MGERLMIVLVLFVFVALFFVVFVAGVIVCVAKKTKTKRRNKLVIVFIFVAFLYCSACVIDARHAADRFSRAIHSTPIERVSNLEASWFACVDCEAYYLRFSASQKTIDDIVLNNNGYLVVGQVGDRLGGIRFDAPGWWDKCKKADKVYEFENAGLWYDTSTGTACYGFMKL